RVINEALCESGAIMPTQETPKETNRIAEQLRNFWEGPSWLGPSLKSILSDLDEEHARRRLIASAHTIWELTLHITAWLRIARERLSATQDRDAEQAENWPAMDGSWAEARSSIEKEVFALEQAILGFPEERLTD